MKHRGIYFDEYRGKLENEDVWVQGYLTILSIKFGHIGHGHYISNEEGKPFAYKVDKNTVKLIEEEETK